MVKVRWTETVKMFVLRMSDINFLIISDMPILLDLYNTLAVFHVFYFHVTTFIIPYCLL